MNCSTASNHGASRKNKPQSGKNNIFNLQQYIARIINHLVELRSKFSHLRGHQNSSRTAHCKSNRFPISPIQGAVDFLECPFSYRKNDRILIVTGALLESPKTFWSTESTSQSPVFWSEFTFKGDKSQHCSTFTRLTTDCRLC